MLSFLKSRRTAFVLPALLTLAASFSLGAQTFHDGRPWKPFKWHYDVSYIDGGKSRNGNGEMELVDRGGDWKFFLRVESGILSFSEVTELRIDSRGRLWPMSRRQRSQVLLWGKTQEYPLHPRPPDQDQTPFHDSSTALLQLVREAGSSKRWRFWVADQNRSYDYRALGRGRVKTPWGPTSAEVIEQLEDVGGHRSLKVWIGSSTGGEPILLRMVRTDKDRVLTLDIKKPPSDKEGRGARSLPGRR